MSTFSFGALVEGPLDFGVEGEAEAAAASCSALSLAAAAFAAFADVLAFGCIDRSYSYNQFSALFTLLAYNYFYRLQWKTFAGQPQQ